jgi:hypothetical protein
VGRGKTALEQTVARASSPGGPTLKPSLISLSPPPQAPLSGPTLLTYCSMCHSERMLAPKIALCALLAVACPAGSTADQAAPFSRFTRQHDAHHGRDLQASPTFNITTGQPPWTPPSAADLARLDRALRPLNNSFDPAFNMTIANVTNYSPGYGTSLKSGTAHPTRESLFLALGLLDTGRAASVERAIALISRVLPWQVSDFDNRLDPRKAQPWECNPLAPPGP